MDDDQTAEYNPEYAFYLAQINAYEKRAEKWVARSKKIVKRYIDDRGDTKGRSKYNILWSNIQTLAPALYDRAPTPNIERRFQDDDDLGRVCSEVLERAVSYYVKSDDFNDCMRQSVLDRLLSGRGTSWVRYVPKFQEASNDMGQESDKLTGEITEDVQIGDDAQVELYSEDVIVDYVHWQDFGHTNARTWQEVRAVWRKVDMDRSALKERFGEEIGAKIPLNSRQKDDNDSETKESRACIYEIWDRKKKTVYWLSKDYQDLLDKRDDPLGLKLFFPCPKPIYATVTNDSLIPTPDFVLYQDQARELDTLTSRIEILTEALKVAGVYDASAEGVQRLLSSNIDNILLPVDSAALLAEKGGLKGVISFLPIQEIGTVLMQLYDARERVKTDLYEITGMSDIIRGASNPNETATAQEIKGQYATLRLGNMQKDVARFSCDIVRLMAEIIAEHFSMDTIKQVSGLRLLTEMEKQQIMMQQQQGQQIPEEIADRLTQPTWEQVEQIIRDDAARCFRIDIETDSTIKADQEAEKSARVEFLSAVGGFMQQAQNSPPEMQPLMAEMLMFGIRAFKVGRDIEGTFKAAMAKIKKQAENPQPPQQDPMIEIKKGELELKKEELGIKQQEVNNTHQKDMLQASLSASPDAVAVNPMLNGGVSPLESIAQALAQGMQQVAESNMQAAMVQQRVAQTMQQSNQMLMAALTAPKETQLIRGNDGKAVSSVTRTVM
jgi:hypothetical protein